MTRTAPDLAGAERIGPLDGRIALVRPPRRPGAPLVFAFHGTGGDETQFAELLPRLLPEAGVIAPRGDVSEHGAARFFRRKAEGVYDMEDLAARRDALADWVAARIAEHPGSPAWGLGYSNGANILAAMAFTRPTLFARLALLHPLIPWTPEPQPGLAAARVLVAGGERDPIAPVAGTRALAEWFRAQGARTRLALHPGGHEVRPEELTALAELFGEP
ncbi:alpha/beta hydrolase [Albimonas sp. CAU 1670]|uniref:alpha/beta hydrolase n=1 Tax=Albimonas sp. CAU 1670 TaxID=3032599 RepID=UPI0023DC43B5|nr:alpha/beta hydrolase [Albimonas sp. CAU 1670]MDF2235289.1 alpha/beta hydrolase [Albimonas sp. CAU 1670]